MSKDARNGVEKIDEEVEEEERKSRAFSEVEVKCAVGPWRAK